MVVFIGNPKDGKKIYLEGRRSELARLRAMDQDVTLGIRPEDIHEYADAAELGIGKSHRWNERNGYGKRNVGSGSIPLF